MDDFSDLLSSSVGLDFDDVMRNPFQEEDDDDDEENPDNDDNELHPESTDTPPMQLLPPPTEGKPKSNSKSYGIETSNSTSNLVVISNFLTRKKGRVEIIMLDLVRGSTQKF